jgi:hypothetical protein
VILGKNIVSGFKIFTKSQQTLIRKAFQPFKKMAAI